MVVNVELTGLTEQAFLEVCRRRGQTPEEVFAAAARHEIAAFLDFMASDVDPTTRKHRERVGSAMRGMLEVAGVARSWPYTESDAPKSLQAAICQAKAHGRKVAAELRAAGLGR